MLRLWRSVSPVARITGAALAITHAVVSWCIIITMVWFGSRDAQWGLIWVCFWVADFPISLVHILVRAVASVGDFADFLEGESRLNILDVVLPSIVFGIIGPLWYGMIPLLVDRLVRRPMRKRV